LLPCAPPPGDAQEHIARQTRDWLVSHSAVAWSNPAGQLALIGIGRECSAHDVGTRLDLASARQRLAVALETGAREARECM
jgi:hypothetical protein